MENGEFNHLGELEKYGDVDGINGDEGCAFPHAREHGSNVRVPRQLVRHARVWNEVLTVSSESDGLGLDIRSNDDEADEKGIGD
jgi:hypothetical protein